MKFRVYRPESKIKFFLVGSFTWLLLLLAELAFLVQVPFWPRGLVMMVILALVGFYVTYYNLFLEFRRYHEISDKNLVVRNTIWLAENLVIPLNNIVDAQYPKRRLFKPKHVNLMFENPVTERRRILFPLFKFSYSNKIKRLSVWVSEKDKFVAVLREKCGLPPNS